MNFKTFFNQCAQRPATTRAGAHHDHVEVVHLVLSRYPRCPPWCFIASNCIQSYPDIEKASTMPAPRPAAALRKAPGVSLAESVYAELKKALQSGRFEPGERLRLLHRTLTEQRITVELRRQKLQRNNAIQPFLPRLVNHPHAAASDLLR